MSRYHSYLNSAKEILSLYKGEEPFASFIKKYFSRYKKFGSKDRKQVSHLCYCFFRLGKALPELATEEKILAGLFLCSDGPNETLAELKPEWNDKINLPLNEKLSLINYQLASLFPWKDELSNEIEYEQFCRSFFQQPDLFLRLRPGKEKMVKGKFAEAGIDFRIISDSCLALDNATRMDTVIELDKEAVVQDYNSQQTAKFLQPVTGNLQQAPVKVWDCCAGSGGKSIMAFDLNSQIELTVSDIRESILINLKKRFERAGIKVYKNFTADLTPDSRLPTHDYNLILADLPCTGSGTWSRTPEQLYFFNEEKINEYASLQKKIISNVIPHLKPGGFLLYITCSVFKKENEAIVEFIQEQFKLELIKEEFLKGYDKKADTMFVALFKKTIA